MNSPTERPQNLYKRNCIPTRDENLKTIIRDCFKDFQQSTAKIPKRTRKYLNG